jgi:hypothetical protein
LDNRPHSQRYREAGDNWAELEKAAQILEDTKSAVMAQRQSMLGDIPVNRAEQIVKSDPWWMDHLTKIVEARYKANKGKINLEVVKMEYYEHNNSEANQRVEIRMTT